MELKLNMFLLGAGGLKTWKHIKDEIHALIPFVDINTIGIDASNANKYEWLDAFYQSDSAGSGGERAENYHKFGGFINTLFSNELHKYTLGATGECNIVISSSSGGSGSMLSANVVPLLSKSKGGCWSIQINDCRDESKAANTFKAMKTLDSLPFVNEVPLVVTVLDNKHGEEEANKEIIRLLTLFGIMGSGLNENLDPADMIAITQLGSKSIKTANDVYLLDISTIADTDSYNYNKPEIARLLSISEIDQSPGVRNNKNGTVKDKRVEAFFTKSEINGIYLEVSNGGMEEIVNNISEVYTNLNKAVKVRKREVKGDGIIL